MLNIPVFPRPSKGKQLLSYISVPMAVAFEQVFACCSLGLCYSAVTAVLSIVLQVTELLRDCCSTAEGWLGICGFLKLVMS